MNPIGKDASPAAKLDAIFLHIYSQKTSLNGNPNSVAGNMINLYDAFAVFDPEFFGLVSQEEKKFYLDVLIEQEMLQIINTGAMKDVKGGQSAVFFPVFGRITYKGFIRLYEIEHTVTVSQNCFIAMAFDEQKNPRTEAIRAACEKFGFNAFTIDMHNSKDNETIDSKIITAIKSSRFCIADFTGLNLGAYMEAGFAMGRGIKVIFVCEEKDFQQNKKHFDVSHYPFKFYRDFRELTDLLVDEIGAYIKQ